MRTMIIYKVIILLIGIVIVQWLAGPWSGLAGVNANIFSSYTTHSTSIVEGDERAC
jgi:hypothetical protein